MAEIPDDDKDHPVTWERIEIRAMHDPVLHRAVTLVRQGTCTREEALLYAAFTLSNIRERQHDRLVEMLKHQPAQHFKATP